MKRKKPQTERVLNVAREMNRNVPKSICSKNYSNY